MNWSQYHEDYMKPQKFETMNAPKKETVIYVELPKADRVYINNIGCLRYELGPLSGPVMSTIDTYLGDYEVSEYKDGRIVLVLKTITPKKEENSAHSFTEGSEVNLRDWPDDFHQENGNYQNICCICENLFIGNKHRVVCKRCAFLSQVKPSVTEESQETQPSDKERIEIAATKHSEKQHLYKGYAKMDFIAGAEYERTIADQQLKEKDKELFELKEEADKQLTFLRNRLSEDREQLVEKEEHIISLKAIIDKLSESDNDVTMAKELAEKDKELSVKTKIIDHWRNEAGAFDLVCQKKSKEIAFLKEALSKAKLYVLPIHGLYKEIENLLK